MTLLELTLLERTLLELTLLELTLLEPVYANAIDDWIEKLAVSATCAVNI
jgi:hypothetical protein